MALATVSALAFTSLESTCPARVTTPFVESTVILATVDGPISEISLAFTWVTICRSLTCASGVSLVLHPIRQTHNSAAGTRAFILPSHDPLIAIASPDTEAGTELCPNAHEDFWHIYC